MLFLTPDQIWQPRQILAGGTLQWEGLWLSKFSLLTSLVCVERIPGWYFLNLYREEGLVKQHFVIVNSLHCISEGSFLFAMSSTLARNIKQSA
jgi:hypothetical protein